MAISRTEKLAIFAGGFFAVLFLLLTLLPRLHIDELLSVDDPDPRPSPSPQATIISVPSPTPKHYPSPTPWGSATPTPTGTPPLPTEDGLMVRELWKFTKGRFVYNVPDYMKQGLTERVEARLSDQDISSDELIRDLKGIGVPRIEKIDISRIMKVSLLGDGGKFDIHSLSTEEQIVSGRDYSQWSWSVTPLSYGEQTLHFKISATIKLEGIGEKAIDIPVLDKKVNVTISPTFIIKSTAQGISWWQFVLGGTTLSGLIVAITSRLRKKKRNQIGF